MYVLVPVEFIYYNQNPECLVCNQLLVLALKIIGYAIIGVLLIRLTVLHLRKVNGLLVS